jgi:phosphoenolpyruvate---glycerone phosphotransferase subunit DhaL
MTLLARLAARFAELEDDLNALDAVAGDGDHGSTMLRGLRAADGAADPVVAFRTATGGASGSLFAQVLGALVAHEAGEGLPDALSRAATRIGMIGQAKPGDRTMLDALLPAASAADAPTAADAARAGAEATREMPARKGRARHVEGAGLGHVDAGARSVAEMLAVLAEGAR